MITLNQIAERAIDAADAGDMDAVKNALRDRGLAIAAMVAQAPSEEQAVCFRTAIEDGKAIDAALVAFKLRLQFERGQFIRLKSGLMAGLGSTFNTRIDYRG